MFDLRYHVASLAAVFLALGLGIIVGVAISDPELAKRTEISGLREQITQLNRDLERAQRRLDEQRAAQAFVTAAYPAVMEGRLAERRIAIVFVGRVDQRLEAAIGEALRSADGGVLRMRALAVPLRAEEVDGTLASRPGLAAYRGDGRIRELGHDLAQEFVSGERTPLWDALTRDLVQEQSGGLDQPADGIVVVRSADPQRGETARFLRGFYDGLGGRAPVVGVEASDADRSSIPVFRDSRFATVDNVETAIGRVALAVLLATGVRGDYGVKDTAVTGVVPPIEPVVARPEAGG